MLDRQEQVADAQRDGNKTLKKLNAKLKHHLTKAQMSEPIEEGER